MAPIRVGLAGYAAGRTLHAPFILEAGGEIAAIATSNPERVEQARAEHPQARIVDDLDALLALDDLDLVAIVTPSGKHVQHAQAAIAAGRPFVIEKPLAPSAEEARLIVDEATSAGVPFAVYHQRRWDPAPLVVLDAARRGRLGETWRLDFGWDRWRPVPRHRWREDAPPADGGGVLLDLGPHVIDFALQLLGPVASVYAELRSRLSPSDDDAFLALTHVRGGITHLTTTSVTAQPRLRMNVLGSQGAYVYHDQVEESYAYPHWNDADAEHAGWFVSGPEREPAPRVPGGHADFYRGVFAALGAPDPQAAMPVEAEAGVRVAEVIDAARRSSACREIVGLHRADAH